MSPKTRLGDEERRLMHLVPAPAVRLMKRRVLSRPGVNSLMVLLFHTPGLNTSSFHFFSLEPATVLTIRNRKPVPGEERFGSSGQEATLRRSLYATPLDSPLISL